MDIRGSCMMLEDGGTGSRGEAKETGDGSDRRDRSMAGRDDGDGDAEIDARGQDEGRQRVSLHVTLTRKQRVSNVEDNLSGSNEGDSDAGRRDAERC